MFLATGPPGKSLNNFKLGTSVCTLPFRKGANTCTRKTLLTNSDLKGLPQEYSKALLVLRETKEVSPWPTPLQHFSISKVSLFLKNPFHYQVDWQFS